MLLIFLEKWYMEKWNWNGSYVSYDGMVDDDFQRELIFRGMSWSENSNCHLWNIFQESGTQYSYFGGNSTGLSA